LEFFADVEKQGKLLGCKNLITLGILVGLYVGLNIFHAINIFVLGNLPLVYIYVAWVQHLMLAAFWVLVTYANKKMKLYMDFVREIINRYKKEKNIFIDLKEKGNIIDFTFRDAK